MARSYYSEPRPTGKNRRSSSGSDPEGWNYHHIDRPLLVPYEKAAYDKNEGTGENDVKPRAFVCNPLEYKEVSKGSNQPPPEKLDR